MYILTLRTDKPEAEIGLFCDGIEKAYYRWEAHRSLAESLHTKIRLILDQEKISLHELNGIAVYQGPGSFTGLRIGAAVANALAAGLELPIVGVEHEAWLSQALQRLEAGDDDKVVVPEYGALPHITSPKK